MNGIDISSYQSTMNVRDIEADFVIVKATQGTWYKNEFFDTQFAQGAESGKLMGIYHYAEGGDPVAEAKFFLKTIEPHIGKAILALDWESGQNRSYGYNDAEWCKSFLDYIWENTGIRSFVYISAGLRFKFAKVFESYPAWIAQYPNYDPVYGYKEHPWNEGAYPCEIRQYTSQLHLNGYHKNIDGDKAYIDREDWIAYQTGVLPHQKTVSKLAEEVKKGLWGNDPERRERLTAAGYDAAAVQREVNLSYLGTANPPEKPLVDKDSEAIFALAKEVISGAWGNDPERSDRIIKAVRAKVNEMMGVSA